MVALIDLVPGEEIEQLDNNAKRIVELRDLINGVLPGEGTLKERIEAIMSQEGPPDPLERNIFSAIGEMDLLIGQVIKFQINLGSSLVLTHLRPTLGIFPKDEVDYPVNIGGNESWLSDSLGEIVNEVAAAFLYTLLQGKATEEE